MNVAQLGSGISKLWKQGLNVGLWVLLNCCIWRLVPALPLRTCRGASRVWLRPTRKVVPTTYNELPTLLSLGLVPLHNCIA